MAFGFSMSFGLSLRDNIHFLRDQLPLKNHMRCTDCGFYALINVNEIMSLENDRENG